MVLLSVFICRSMYLYYWVKLLFGSKDVPGRFEAFLSYFSKEKVIALKVHYFQLQASSRN